MQYGIVPRIRLLAFLGMKTVVVRAELRRFQPKLFPMRSRLCDFSLRRAKAGSAPKAQLRREKEEVRIVNEAGGDAR
jgi:hypothetical protein